MDILAIREKTKDWFKQYRCIGLVVAAGLLLMLLPVSRETESQPQEVYPQQTPALQEQLGELLSHMQGAGKVRVLLTEGAGEEILYQTDQDFRTDTRQSDTVIITGEDRVQTGLVRQVNPPEYLGAVVLCQGADNASVKLSIVEAVSKATGLTTDRITVLKMK